MHRSLSSFSILFLALVLIGMSLPTYAQTDSEGSLQVVPQDDGVRLEWQGSVGVTRSGEPVVGNWSEIELNGLKMPGQLVTVQVPDDEHVDLAINSLTSLPWAGSLAAVDAPVPQTVDGDERPALVSTRALSPPSSPVVVLQDGRMRGTRIVVLAVSPIFAQDGALRAATDFQITIPGATPLAEDASQMLSRSTPFLTDAPGPTNPAVSRAIVKIHVAETGMQRVTGAALADAGINLTTLTPARLQLWHNGEQIALEERGTTDGRLDAADELRFFAPTPGDRWNTTDTYWLTVESTNGLRISARNAQPGSGSVNTSTTAFEQGVWRNNTIYDPTLPGPDGDHWYAVDLRTGPGQPAAALSAVLTPTLPLAGGNATITVAGSAYTEGQHKLSVKLGGDAQTVTWDGTDTWTQTVTLANGSANVMLSLVPGSKPDGVEVDSIAWKRPVQLNFGNRGAMFSGRDGRWRYSLSETPDGRLLYDVSNPTRPERLKIAGGANVQFEDESGQRDYLLTGPGTLQTPNVMAYQPVNLSAGFKAAVVYITPASLQSALEPLIVHRRAQGHAVQVVEVQAIYDAWGFGQVAPAAIRDFLRYAASTWSLPPANVILVGDGTSDPHDYTMRGENNVNFIPPYLEMVDPWIGETACETCYAQLNGADPVFSPDADMFPDLALGRLPAKSAAELEQLVAKIVGYETNLSIDGWRSRNVYIADNFREVDGTVDGAGDFARISEASISEQPKGIDIQRVFYDPWKKDGDGNRLNESWREPDAAKARSQAFAAINAGAGLVNYTGHSNHWRWAVTDQSENNHLLELFEADQLTNGERLPIILSMTCWSSAFQQPARSGTTLDERLLMNPNGGGAAVWGPTGLGVAYGHDALQRGFYTALWQAPPMQASLGELTLAGYLELLTNGGCCYDAVHTYVLLGDPLTNVRVLPGASSVFLPFAQR